MKLSIRINAPEDSQGAPDGGSNTESPDIHTLNLEHTAQVLSDELGTLYPPSQAFEHSEISLTFINPEGIRELNRQYRNVDEATDVLSFPLLEDEPVNIPELPELALGDIVICPEEVSRLHPELDPKEALYLMIAHSFLHLLGFDHDTDEKQKVMWSLQEAITARLMEDKS